MAGRPKAIIDWEVVTEHIKAQCSAVGIASMFGISVDTLYNRCKADNNVDYSAFSEQKKAEGKELLRKKQYEVAMEGDKTMLVWLGKQYLEQKEKTETDLHIKEMPPLPDIIIK